MMHSRPLSPLELDASIRAAWIDGDIVYPTQSQRLNGHIVSGGNGSVNPYPDELWMPEDEPAVSAQQTISWTGETHAYVVIFRYATLTARVVSTCVVFLPHRPPRRLV